MSVIRALIALAFVFALSVAQAQVERKCVPADTLQECWNRYLPEQSHSENKITSGAHAEQAKSAAANVETLLNSFETGLGGGTAELATTTHNFLPLLAMSGLIADSDGNPNDRLFTIDLNFLLGNIAKDHNAQLRAVLNTDPQMFGPLKQAFDTATGSTDRSAALQKSLSASDDYTISFTYSHISRTTGRSFKQYQLRYSNLFESAITVAGEDMESEDRGLVVMEKTIQKLDKDPAHPISDATVLSNPNVLDVVENAARQEAELEQRVRQTAAANKLSRFEDLINNQPQLTLSAEFHDRNPIVGAREQSIKVSYELGLANVNNFNSRSKGACNLLDGYVDDLALADAKQCLNSLRDYIEKNEQTLKNADRFSFEASYVKVGDYDFVSPNDKVSLKRAATHRLDMSVGYGRTVRLIGDGYDSRLDFVAKYEDYSDDSNFKDRFVATATLTTKLNGISIPFAVVYANHEKFLPDTDKKLSVHVGIKYQLDSK